MKTVLKIFFASIPAILFSVVGFCQIKDSTQFRQGIPEVSEDSLQVPGKDFNPKESFVQISAEQVPQELFTYLNEQPQFEGWEEHIILFDKNTGLYWLRITTDKVVRTYGFTAKGKPVKTREETRKTE